MINEAEIHGDLGHFSVELFRLKNLNPDFIISSVTVKAKYVNDLKRKRKLKNDWAQQKIYVDPKSEKILDNQNLRSHIPPNYKPVRLVNFCLISLL